MAKRKKEAADTKKFIKVYDIYYFFIMMIVYVFAVLLDTSIKNAMKYNYNNYILIISWILPGIFYPIFYKVIYKKPIHFFNGIAKIFLITAIIHLVIDSYSIIEVIKNNYRWPNEVYGFLIEMEIISFVYLVCSYIPGYLISRYLMPLRKKSEENK